MSVDVASFKAYFDRGQFSYGANAPDIRDKDITQALAEATAVFNPDIYPTDKPEIKDSALTYLTAHFLVTDIDAQDSGGQARLLQTARAADGVSESLAIPEWVTGELIFYWTTYYGQKWLILTKPYLDGAVFSIGGATQP